MLQAVELSEALITSAQICGAARKRSLSGQIEYWASIGRVVEENSDLPPDFVLGTLLAKAEADAGDVEEYVFG